MAQFPKNHDRLYFDALCRTKKGESVLSLIHATYQAKSGVAEGEDVKQDIAERLVRAYELFKGTSGSYSGDLGQFESQYTIGHELCIWKNSDLDLTDLAIQVAENKITIRDYFDIVFLNFIQPVNNNIVHVLYHLLEYMNDNNLKTITKEEMGAVYKKIGNATDDGNINGAFNMLLGTNYFVASSKNQLDYIAPFSIKELMGRCDTTYIHKGYEIAKEELKDNTKYIEYMLKDSRIKESIEEDSNIFEGFAPWLTSYDNPDYTGREKYAGYPRALERLVEFMLTKELIEDSNLNDKNLDKYINYIKVYNSSDEAKEFDEKYLASKAGIAALKKYIKYVEFLAMSKPQVKAIDFNCETIKGKGVNKIFYGVPGCGKSYHIEHKVLKERPYTEIPFEKENIIRTTFYQDYSNADFVGQILPKIVREKNGDRDSVEYIFNPGPFTLALIQAISNPTEKVALVVEEINRGNAPAIFGDIFQLLDRDDDCISEYGIVNVGVIDYLNNYEFIIDGEKKKYIFNEIKIPGNMYIYATMNTSDQNVYTLDTAFTRRWSKERIPNEFNGNEIADMYVPGMKDCTWATFVDKVNHHIRSKIDELQVNEDKQVGCFFVKKSDLLIAEEQDENNKKAKLFAYKVLEYLWDDVSKLDHSVIFAPHYTTFEDLVKDYLAKGVDVFNGEIFK